MTVLSLLSAPVNREEVYLLFMVVSCRLYIVNKVEL